MVEQLMSLFPFETVINSFAASHELLINSPHGASAGSPQGTVTLLTHNPWQDKQKIRNHLPMPVGVGQPWSQINTQPRVRPLRSGVNKETVKLAKHFLFASMQPSVYLIRAISGKLSIYVVVGGTPVLCVLCYHFHWKNVVHNSLIHAIGGQHIKCKSKGF